MKRVKSDILYLNPDTINKTYIDSIDNQREWDCTFNVQVKMECVKICIVLSNSTFLHITVPYKNLTTIYGCFR